VYATVLVSFILVVTIYSAVILATTSSDWLSPVKISPNYTDCGYLACKYGYPAIAVDSSGIYIVWQKYMNGTGNFVIYYANSSDGSNWSWQNVSNTSHDYQFPDIAVDSNGVAHIVWTNNSAGYIFYTRSSNWSDIKTIAYVGQAPSISTVADGVHIAWQDYRGEGHMIYYKKLHLNGDLFINETLLANTSMHPDIASNLDNVYVVWYDSRTGNNEIYLNKSTNGGSTWSNGVQITNSTYDSTQPAVAVGPDGKIYIAWSDNRDGNYEIYYAYSSDGSNWTERRVTNDPELSTNPDIAVDSHGINIVWQGWESKKAFYANSVDGSSWSTSELGQDNQGSYEPCIATYGGNTHVVWRNNKTDIYYSRKNRTLSLIINHNTSDSTIVLGVDSRDGIVVVNYNITSSIFSGIDNITSSTFSGTVSMDVYNESGALFYHQDGLDYNTAVWDGTDGKGNYADPEKNYTMKITASD